MSAVLPLDVADNVDGPHAVLVPQTLLVYDRDGGVQVVGHVPRPLRRAHVSRGDHQVLLLQVAELLRQQRYSRQLVQWDVEEALYLTGVQVRRQHPVGPRHGDEVRDQARSDGHAGLVLLVRPPVGVVRDHRRDPPPPTPSAPRRS